jgi:hypothetical protein
MEPAPFMVEVKRTLAMPWNRLVKPTWKKLYRQLQARRMTRKPTAGGLASTSPKMEHLKTGDVVRVRSLEEIQATLDRWQELRGCAFLEYMGTYCGTTQRVMQPMERFLDERDYKVKKVKGVVILENVICRGTPVFGRCDRCCHLFWREEWLEKIAGA